MDVATEIFTRINVTGKPLSVFEIMVAKTFDADADFDLSEKYDSLKDELRAVSYETISSSTVLQVVSTLMVGECSKKDILKLDKKKFIATWPHAEKSIKSAVDYFRDQYRIPVSKLLPYAALLVPFSYFFHRHGKSRLVKCESAWPTSSGECPWAATIPIRWSRDSRRTSDASMKFSTIRPQSTTIPSIPHATS